MTTEYLEKLIAGCNTDKQVKAALDKAGISYYDDPYAEVNGKHYMSLHIDKYFRIYRVSKYLERIYGKYKVQKFEEMNLTYSGIPVFFDTFDKSF